MEAWKVCEGCVSFEIPPLILKLIQGVGCIQQGPVEGRSVVGEMEAQLWDDNLERSEITKRVSAEEEELRLMNQVQGSDNRTENGSR